MRSTARSVSGIDADDLGAAAPAVGEQHLDFIGALDDVVVGEDVPVTR
jgi:hypothetical protein